MAVLVGKALVTVLGVFGGVVDFASFIPSEFPDKNINWINREQQADDSMVHIAVRLNYYNELAQPDGPTPLIVAFEENKEYVSASNWYDKDNDGFIPCGGYMNMWIAQRGGPREQVAYLQVLGYADGVCVAYISQTQADGTPRGWLGDMGRACGKRGYYSNIIVGGFGHRPDCTWLNRDGSCDGTDTILHNQAAAMQIHMEDFTNFTSDYNRDTDFYCNEPAMVWVNRYSYKIVVTNQDLDHITDAKRIHFWTPKDAMYQKDTNTRLVKRAKPTRRSTMFDSRLVTSVYGNHSARDLCGDENAPGLDFVSYAENAFCDMAMRKVWPLCEKGVMKEECYDVGAHALITTASEYLNRNYVHVEEWN